MRNGSWLWMAWSLAWGAPLLGAGEMDEYRVQRQEVFEFTQKPLLTRHGDRVEIAFASKGYCDATVVIESAEGTILRHLASGVLGPKAPEPFQKSALEQKLVWDGKDDQGKYLDNKDSLCVRVSLGLKPRFERSLLSEPKRRLGSWQGGATQVNRPTPVIVAAPEGVYVFEGKGVDQLRLFDHQGNYLRTVYPFPASKLSEVKGLNWVTPPQDTLRQPHKCGFLHSTLLTSGMTGQKDNRERTMFGAAASAMAVNKDRIALAMTSLNRLATDGSTGGLPLSGPKVTFPIVMDGINRPKSPENVNPLSIALSPDNKWLYLAGYMWREYSPHHSLKDCLHGVARMAFEGNEPPKLFAGSFKQNDSGTEEGRFKDATSVACDAQGRVYVTDYINDRIQVFSPEGKFLKAISVYKPARVSLHAKTGELYVYSVLLANDTSLGRSALREKTVVKPALTRLGPYDDPKPRATYPLPVYGVPVAYGSGDMLWGGIESYGEMDTYVDPPVLWLVPSTAAGIQLLQEKDGQLTLKRDFGAEAKKYLGKTVLPEYWRQRLYVNPKTEKLWVAEQHTAAREKAFKEVLEIDPGNGAMRLMQLPFDTEDAAFDPDGLFYMRDHSQVVARYDPKDWREVPYDYGEEREKVTADSNSNRREAKIISGLPIYNGTGWHKGGMSVSVKGHLVISLYVTKGDSVAGVSTRTGQASIYWGANAAIKPATPDQPVEGSRYTPLYYPGRFHFGETHVYDRHGKILHADILPGAMDMYGVGVDKDDNFYALMSPTRLKAGGKLAFWELTGTLLKCAPRKAKVVCAQAGPHVQIPLAEAYRPNRPAEGQKGSTQFWFEGAEWLYGGVGFCGKNATYSGGGCACWNSRFTLDYLGRSFAPEIDRSSVAVLDSSGNLILHVGRYGNLESAGPDSPVPLGGDEVGLVYACYVGTHTDRRLFIADAGNQRVSSVLLEYHVNEKIPLRSAPDAAKRP